VPLLNLSTEAYLTLSGLFGAEDREEQLKIPFAKCPKNGAEVPASPSNQKNLHYLSVGAVKGLIR